MESNRYTKTAVTLHWLVAILIAGTFSVGLYMHDLPLSPQKLKIYSWHKWAGVTVFILVLVRLSWRIGHRPPSMPATMPRWQRVAAHALHHLLYLMMVLVPLTGWLMSSAKGFQTVYFGILPIPDLLGKNEALGDLLQAFHKYLNFGFAVLVAGHTVAAIKHHVVDRDDILVRMIPFLAKSR